MAGTGTGNGGLQTAISLSGLGSLAAGALTTSGAFTIPLAGSATAALCDSANLQLECTSFTASANPAYIQGLFITEDDGANYDVVWAANSQLQPTDSTFFTMGVQYNVATTFVKVKNLVLPSSLSGVAAVKLVLLNLSGVAITVSSAQLFCYGGMIG